ncbi:MAG: general secretion pathway protein GspK [Desulfovibrionaceae bacterium]|jgi:general secretion pathway protein K|nr:general secretion pathway protein GspK [Desulfovibrionaceae bacterium]
MALVAVLWIVAALSIMATGLTYTVRQQIQVVGMVRDQASGQAIGEGAAALVLQDMLAHSEQRVTGVASTQVSYGGAEVTVDVAPLNGWIPLNGAGEPLLTALLATAGGLDQGQAQALAARLIEWRDGRPEIDPTSPGGASAQSRRFEATEDLLLVPGIDYALYARIAPLVSADVIGGQVNPQAAPAEVLAVLAQGDAGLVGQFMAQRTSGPGADTSGFNGAFLGSGGGGANIYRLRVRVPLEAGKILLLTRDVALGAAYSRTAPWVVLRADRQIVSASAG